MLNYWKIISSTGIFLTLVVALHLKFETDAILPLTLVKDAGNIVGGISNTVDSTVKMSGEIEKNREQLMSSAHVSSDITSCQNITSAYDLLQADDVADDWQTVIKDVVYVYSAHVDPRHQEYSIIRVFGIMSGDEVIRVPRRSYYCQIRAERSTIVNSTEAMVFTLAENWPPKFRMMEFQCRVNINPWSLPPLLVSITTQLCTEANNQLIVRQNYKNGFETNFTLCLNGVLKHGTSSPSQIVEWIELNMLLGAEHVFIYNFSGSPILNPYLRYYQRKGLLTVLPWNIPIQFREDIDEFDHDFHIVWNYAQTVLLNDCLYRNIFVARKLVYVDLDEFIIPQEEDVMTWSRMLRHARDNCSQIIGSFCARNGFFQMSFVNDSNFDRFNLTTALHTIMFMRIKECFGRSKYIVIPERIQRLNIHFVEEYYDDMYKACAIEPSIGFLHHYRPLNRHKPTETNLAAFRFKDGVINRMSRVFDEVST